MRRIANILLAIMFAVLLVLPAAGAGEKLKSGDYEYTLSPGGATITKYKGGEVWLTIPDTLDGHPVTAIGVRAFSGNDSPEGVTTIDEYAFFGCDALTLTVHRGSYAAEYAQERGIPFIYPDSLDWLTS